MFSHSVCKSGRNGWRLFYALILTGAALWCAAIMLAPLLSESRPLVGKWIGFFFSRICHQNPDRSFSCAGEMLPVCARCTGIYLGFLFSAILYPLLRRRMGKNFSWRIWFGIAIALSLVEWGASALLRAPNLWPRAATGFLLGGVIGLCAASGLNELFTRKGRLSS